MPSQLKSILVGVDLGTDGSGATPGSLDAIAQARWVAGQSQGAITLLHSLAADECWDPLQSQYVPIGERNAAEAEAALEGLAEELRSAGVRTQVATCDEPAAIAVIHSVLRHRHDLVVMGKRSHPRRDVRGIGSAALRVIRKCPCPAWMVEPGSSDPPRTVLACTALQPAGDVAVQIASWLTTCASGELHITHAYQWPMDIQMSGSRARDAWNEQYRRETAAHIRGLLEAGQQEAAHLHLGLTSPTAAIQESLQRLQPDLLVMGSISRAGLPGIIIGNTAERVFETLTRSLLVVKPDDFVCPIQL